MTNCLARAIETYFPTFDGNGNVTGLVKGEDAGVANSAGTSPSL